MTDTPPQLAERLAELDRFIAANESVIEDAEAQIKAAWLSLEKYRLAKAEVENAVALCREAWGSPQSTESRSVENEGEGERGRSADPLTAAPPTVPRQRRDMRDVVRQILRACPAGADIATIATMASLEGRKVRATEVERALERMNGEVEQIGDRWRLAVGPPGTIPRDQQPLDGDSQALPEKHLVRDAPGPLSPQGDGQADSAKKPSMSGADNGRGAGPITAEGGEPNGGAAATPPAADGALAPTEDEILAHIAQAGDRGVERSDAHEFAGLNRASLHYLVMTNRVEITARGYRAIEAA